MNIIKVNPGEGEVMDKFELDGKEAEIVRFNEDDIASIEPDLAALAWGLVETDFKDSVYSKTENLPRLKVVVQNKKIQEMKDHILNDDCLCIRADGKVVSVSSAYQMSTMPDGRPLIELSKGATHDDYRGKKMAKILAVYLMRRQMEKNPNVVWVGFSRNDIVLDALTSAGWKALAVNSNHPRRDYLC